MNLLSRFAAYSTISAVLSTGALFAQDDHRDDHRDQNQYHDEHRDADQRDNHAYVRHDEWRKGYHMRHEDWDRGEHIDYRTYHLQAPRRGYEWREVDGNFVMAAGSTGVVASVVAGNSARR